MSEENSCYDETNSYSNFYDYLDFIHDQTFQITKN